jgi:hypothetical protein
MGEAYRVVKGLSISDGAQAIKLLQEMVQACHERKHCPKFAITEGLSTFPDSLLFDDGKGAQHLASVLLIGNAQGQYVKIIFVHWDEETSFDDSYEPPAMFTKLPAIRFPTLEKRRVVKNKSILLSDCTWDLKQLSQLYNYIHYKLDGPCAANTTQDESRMSRLDQLEEHVNAIMNSELDVSAQRNENLQLRFEAIDEKLKRLAERIDDSKRQKTE